MRRVWVKVVFALLLLVMMSSACSAIRWFKKPTYDRTGVVKKTVLVFPFDVAPEVNVSEDAPRLVAETMRNELQRTGKYSVVVFSPKLAPVQRAIEVDKVFPSAKQVEPPYTEDIAKTVKIAEVMSVDYALCGMIESYAFDAASKSASVLLSAQMVDVRSGKTVAGYTVTGKATASGDGVDENELAREAIVNGVTKLGMDRTSMEEPAGGGGK